MVIGTTSVCRIKTQTKASYSVFFALAFQTESGASGTQATLDKSGLTSSPCSSTQWGISYIILFHQKLRLRYTLLTSQPNIFAETCPAALLTVYPN